MGDLFGGISDAVNGVVGGIGGAISGFDLGNALGTNNNYQTALDPAQQRALAEAIMQSQGNLQSIYGQQNNLASMLQQQAQGGGPNPAQMMLNNSTNKNISQNAGQIANIKGINPAMAGRMLAQNAGMMNQQAAGQGALMGAQQQLGAQNSLSGLYGQMGQQQIGGMSAMGGVLNPTQALNADTSKSNQQANTGLLGGLMSGASAAFIPKKAHGGVIEGGAIDPHVPNSKVGKFLSGIFEEPVAMNAGGVVDMRAGGEIPGHAKVPGDSIKNDVVPIMASPDEIMIPRSIILGPNPAKMAALFVQNELNKKKKGA